LSALLRASDFEVDTALGGAEALLLFEASPYDAVFTDLTMPGMDGLELMRHLRAFDLDVPIMILTAAPTMESAIKAVEYGAMHYLLKPVRQVQLVKIAEKAVRLRQMARLKREALGLMGILDKDIGDQAGLDAIFDRALGSLFMHYQPIVRWSDRKVIAWEALVRSGEDKMAHPGAIFAAAERLVRVIDVGRRVRLLAPEPFAQEKTRLFVNLHIEDLKDDDLYNPSSSLAQMSDRVVLEITERHSLETIPDAHARVRRLRNLGYAIAVDDLGAGYAGLTAFSALEPEVVKLDMALIRNVHASPTKQKLIGSMASLCGDLGMEMIAEGVETEDERDTLVHLGCDLFQGFLFSKPSLAFPTVHF